MVFGGEVFGRFRLHEWDQGPYKRDASVIPHSFHYVMTQRKDGHLGTRRQASSNMESVGTLILDFLASGTVRKRFLLFMSHVVYGIFVIVAVTD